MIRTLTITLLLLSITLDVMADGRMVWKENIPPKIPYQRALILFKHGVETLILQSKYEIPPSTAKQTLGWVVPVPSNPEVASMPADKASELFSHINYASQPNVFRIVYIPIIAFEVAWVLSAILYLISFCSPYLDKHRIKIGLFFLFGLFVSIAGSLFLPQSSQYSNVDIIAEHRVGIYNVQVVKSRDSGDMIAWLNANEFRFTEQDKTAIESYIAKGWCFVVAKIDSAAEGGKGEIITDGLAAPLILRFPQQLPVYPLVLTGAGNHETEILLYIAANTKMSCDDRMKLRYAGDFSKGSKHVINLADSMKIKPVDFFKTNDLSYPYLCKFKSTLKPSEMRQDITFAPAQDNTAYREFQVRW